MTTAYIGFGSNLGDRQRLIEESLCDLAGRSGIQVTGVSPIYETDPVSILDQPRFLNAAARLTTFLSARALLEALLEAERRMGRRRDRKWGPRSIDLDLLLYGGAVICEEGLVVPHPHLTERLFVLAPLCDLDDTVVHPLLKRTLRDLYVDLCGHNPLKPIGRLNWKRT